MTLEQLHQEYGKLMISAEILNGKIMEIKKQIAEKMNEKKPVSCGSGEVQTIN